MVAKQTEEVAAETQAVAPAVAPTVQLNPARIKDPPTQFVRSRSTHRALIRQWKLRKIMFGR